MKFIYFLLCLTLSQCKNIDFLRNPLSDEFLELVQSQATTWKAGRNFHNDTPVKHLYRLLGFVPMRHSLSDEHDYRNTIKPMPEGFQLPDSFDAREQWPYCPTIKEIRDQGSCGSCWAIAPVEVMSDRTCIYSEGKDNFHYSTEDLLSCCNACGHGCDGGDPIMAFKYWVNHGLVSGGNYNSSQGCEPYEIPPCEHDVDGSRPDCSSEDFDTPACTRKCDSSYPLSYDDDTRHGARMYKLFSELDAMNELVTNGSISATFDVYDDFFYYKSGVYQRISDSILLGGHVIRIIGYGTEGGVPYWLCANSWNEDWGDKGLFKILRGQDECKIEDYLITGTPQL